MQTLTALILMTLGASAQAQDAPRQAVFDRIAETIAEAGSQTGEPIPDGWYAVGIRASHARWHLAEPDDGDGWFRRTGWISVYGRQAGIAACGPEAGVAALGFQFPGESGEPLLDALSPIGTLTAEDVPGEPVWRFEPEGRVPARISLSVWCTPEGSAAARSCRTHVIAAFVGDPRGVSCRAP